MRSVPFLLEIGAEEIPDGMIQPALNHLRELFEGLLKEQRLTGEVAWVEGTPRRLALKAEGLPARQPANVEVVTGPPKAAGENAAAGFARKMGVEVSALKVVKTPKGDYYACRRRTPGRPTLEILASALPELILKIYFPKTMYWTGKNGPRFIRPIRWLVALLGNRVVPFEIAGVRSGRFSSGHRQLGKPKIRVSIEDYQQRLRENYVLVSSAERRARIEAGLDGAAPDAGLLNTLVYLTEYPTPIAGSFDPAFLSLPEEVLVTVMRHHQRYFSVRSPEGKLEARFIAVTNTDGDPEGLIRQGNERVLRARFNDAKFFWDFDQQKPLADRVEELAHVTWQAQLGSYLDKTRRMVELVKELGGSEAAQRAALLSKCDLTTEMVKEFTELQGIMGGLYARAQGEPEAVWRAIYEHYQPVSMDDPIPSTPDGRLVSLADKLDTLRGCFGIGLIPSGSKDPFGLRRAAQGVVKILAESELPLKLSRLIEPSETLREFLLDRVRYYFREVRGFAYDEVNAVLAAGWDDLADAGRRLAALRAVRPTPNFEPLAASFKRIRNILRQAQFTGGPAVEEALLEAGPERDLFAAFAQARLTVQEAGLDYRSKLEAIAALRPAVDRYFDHVLVNAPDERVRTNRLAMLHEMLTELSSIADFSEIVTQGNPTE
jgi:glycyl-tRNA synthetase beta chain